MRGRSPRRSRTGPRRSRRRCIGRGSRRWRRRWGGWRGRRPAGAVVAASFRFIRSDRSFPSPARRPERGRSRAAEHAARDQPRSVHPPGLVLRVCQRGWGLGGRSAPGPSPLSRLVFLFGAVLKPFRFVFYKVWERSPLTKAVMASGSTFLPNAMTLKSSPISASETSFCTAFAAGRKDRVSRGSKGLSVSARAAVQQEAALGHVTEQIGAAVEPGLGNAGEVDVRGDVLQAGVDERVAVGAGGGSGT